MTIERSSAEASINTNMSVNSSDFDDYFVLFFDEYFVLNECLDFNLTSFFLSVAAILYTLLLLPLIILVAYLGFQKSRKQRSSSTATSHSDHFTYHSTFMQLNELLGLGLSFSGRYFYHKVTFDVGNSLLNYTSAGQALFHLLTCVERYLAVVHPLTYLGLRQGGGVRIRNISIGCVWFISFGYIPFWYKDIKYFHASVTVCFLVLLLCVLFFCSISVLYVLKRSGPGGGTRERVDQSKQRAFYTIMAIMGALLLKFGGGLITYALSVSTLLSTSTVCAVTMFSFWFALPSSLILPLLFLRGAGKPQCCKQNTESG